MTLKYERNDAHRRAFGKPGPSRQRADTRKYQTSPADGWGLLVPAWCSDCCWVGGHSAASGVAVVGLLFSLCGRLSVAGVAVERRLHAITL